MAIRFGDAVNAFLQARDAAIKRNRDNIENQKAQMELENI